MSRRKKQEPVMTEEQGQDYATQLAEQMLALVEAMTEDEKAVFNRIGDTFDEAGYPVLTFQNGSLAELNSAFNCQEPQLITERVRQALDALRKYDDLVTLTQGAPTEKNNENLGEMLLQK